MNKTAARLRHAERIEKALTLRSQRVSWSAIAAELGWSSATVACRAVTKYTTSHPTPGIETIRDQCRAELEQSARELHEIIRDLRQADYSPATIAKLAPPLYTELRQCNESMRKLDGADKPARIILEGDDHLDEEIEADWAAIVSNLRAELPGPAQ